MKLLEALEWRYASKKMNGQPVPQEKVERILEAIRLAPSSMGLQPYTVLVITDPELKKQILPIANNQQQIIDSSHLLVFAAWNKITPEHVDEYIKLIAKTRNVGESSLQQFKAMLTPLAERSFEDSLNWTARQTYIAFGTAIAAAAEEHVDATPMEGFNNVALDKLLNLNEKGLRSVTLLPLGYRDAEKDVLATSAKVRRNKEELFLLQ
ncbi:NAD(P)H-dependent oxidoreductase [Segetibacter sp. 3557_3]|uniref:nitroreductase family protein n=1 Tax=Segetibacter sp. 3557_3 TaxID=2547429 RepID=UPI0010586092|nr:nitroreductase family protein [Segetibacter sp. 3557_3]TDH27317.1 NAD(P)H-dependent oxidoreductase [Segetibacter sp. 3557_3]